MDYQIKYSSSSKVKIPSDAIELPKELDNLGKVYLVHKDNKTDVYLDYSIGIKIEKPSILSVTDSEVGITIHIRRPSKGIFTSINYHFFLLEFDKHIEHVFLVEHS